MKFFKRKKSKVKQSSRALYGIDQNRRKEMSDVSDDNKSRQDIEKDQKDREKIEYKRGYSSDILNIKKRLVDYDPHKYESLAKDFESNRPIFHGNVSHFYGKPVKIKRLFFKKMKNMV